MTGYPQQKRKTPSKALLRADSWFTGCFFSGTDNFSEYLARQFTMAAVFTGQLYHRCGFGASYAIFL